MQMILTYILAYGFTAYYPIKYILLEPMKIKDFVSIIFLIVILIVFTSIFWKEGEKRYESSGS